VRGQSDAPRPNGSSSQQLIPKDKQFWMGFSEKQRCMVRAVGDEGRMAKKLSKNMVKARALVERRPYTLIDAVPLIKKAKLCQVRRDRRPEYPSGR